MARTASPGNHSSRNSALLVLTFGALACARGVPAPEFPTPFDVVAPDSIRTHLEDLEFDERDGAGDEQPLVLGCPAACRIGPQVALHPERRTHKNSANSLAKGPGRIIARMINRDQKEGYPKFNLAPGDTVYWAVDSVMPVSRKFSRGRSLYISAKGLRGEQRPVVLPGPLLILEHPDEETVEAALARWVVDSAGYDDAETPGGNARSMPRLWTMAAWANCKSSGCCR